MKNLVFAVKFSFFAFVLLAANAICAQEPAAQIASKPAAASPRRLPKRPGLLQLLNLTDEQVRQIRQINRETRAETRLANQRQRQARRLLDAAIYADSPDQAAVEKRARELAEAQSEAIKLRASVEFRVRQILTNEQLEQFRQLRQRVSSQQ